MSITHKALLAALTDISGIGDARAYELYTHFSDPLELFDAPDSLLQDFHYIDSDTLAALQSLDEAVETYGQRFETYESDGITVIGVTDEQYPDSVRANPAPVLLYAKGNIDLLSKPAVGVSGSRETNATGQQWIQSLAAEISQEGYVVVSGGARGADTAAHRGAIETPNSTIVVLGTGVNVAYPPENQSLFDEVLQAGGLLLSMRPPDAEPTSHAFIERNELIAALSDGLIFVATDGSGGTMAQYEMARDRGRPTFVPPATLEIEPQDGISTLRTADDTTTIRTATDIKQALSVAGSQQLNLDEWT